MICKAIFIGWILGRLGYIIWIMCTQMIVVDFHDHELLYFYFFYFLEEVVMVWYFIFQWYCCFFMIIDYVFVDRYFLDEVLDSNYFPVLRYHYYFFYMVFYFWYFYWLKILFLGYDFLDVIYVLRLLLVFGKAIIWKLIICSACLNFYDGFYRLGWHRWVWGVTDWNVVVIGYGGYFLVAS